MAIRALIFDFDGTVADTFGSVVDVLNSLADEFGYRRARPEEYPLLSALGPRELADRIGLAWHKVPLLVARVRKEMRCNMSQVKAFQGVESALVELRTRGLRLGLLTSNNRDNVEAFLAANPRIQFDFVSTGSGLFAKHTRLKRLLAKHRLLASETCYVGDEVRDIEAARELGVRAVAVTWGFSAPQLLAANQPDHLLSDPAELLTLL